MTNATATRKPYIVAEGEKIDVLGQFDTMKVRTNQLKPGMVLVDEVLATPAAVLDHRIGSTRGIVSWLVEDVTRGSYIRASFTVSNRPTATVAVAP